MVEEDVGKGKLEWRLEGKRVFGVGRHGVGEGGWRGLYGRMGFVKNVRGLFAGWGL